MKVRKLGFVTLTIAALAAAGCSSSADGTSSSGDGTITIRVQAQNSIAAEPLYMGIEKGFFEDEGITIDIVDLPDFSAAFAALQAGKLDVAFSPTISVLQASRQGLPLTMIAAADGVNPAAAEAPVEEQRNYTSAGLYASEGSAITSIDDLAGASIAVPELKGQADGTITSVLREAGVPTDDIEWLNLGFVPALAALKDDKLDAAFLVSPFTLDADAAGLTRVMNPSVSFFPPGAATSAWVTSKDWVASHADAVARFQRAMAASAAWSSENIDEVKAHVIVRAGLDLKPEQMPQSYWPSQIMPDDLEAIDAKLVDIGFFDKSIDVTTVITPAAQ